MSTTNPSSLIEASALAAPAPVVRWTTGVQVPNDLLETLGPMKSRGWFAVVIMSFFFIVGLVAYIHQLQVGLSATAMTDYFSWGIYIVNFVFFIGISMAGTLISSGLRLTAVP